MSFGGGGESAEAKRAREEEEARQARIRQGTSDINRIFDGGVTGSGRIAAGAAYDPNATYYNADGTVWTPTMPVAAAARPQEPVQRLGGGRGGHGSSGSQSFAKNRNENPRLNNTPSLEQQFAAQLANGGLFSGTTQQGGFNDDFYRGIRDSFTNYAMPQLNQQRDDAAKQLAFALDRTGQLSGSVRGQKTGELQRLFDINEQQVRDQALAYENQSRTSVENARADLIGMLNATGDNQQAVNSALSRSTILTQPQAYSPLGQLFTDFTAGLGAQAAQERAAAASGGMYKSRYDTGLFGGAGRVTVR